MATAEEALFAHLRADGALRDLVGDRIYPRSRVPREAGFPRVTFFLVTTRRIQVLRGTTTGKAPLFQIEAWADGERAYEKAKAVAVAVAAIFQDGYRGELGSSGLTSKGTIVEDESDESDAAMSGEESGICRVRLDVRIHHAA